MNIRKLHIDEELPYFLLSLVDETIDAKDKYTTKMILEVQLSIRGGTPKMANYS